MRELKKRWGPVRLLQGGKQYRIFLSEPKTYENPDPLSWGCIEATSREGPFRLEIWNDTEEEWDEVARFPTLKQAKTVGRLLAGVALAQAKF